MNDFSCIYFAKTAKKNVCQIFPSGRLGLTIADAILEVKRPQIHLCQSMAMHFLLCFQGENLVLFEYQDEAYGLLTCA